MNLAIAESQLRDYNARLGKPFLHEEYFAELTMLRDRLKVSLSAGRGTETDSVDSASELAQSIKNLKAGQTIDSSPQRLGQVRLSAEVPVTGSHSSQTGRGGAFGDGRRVGVREASNFYSLLGLAGAHRWAAAVRPSLAFYAVSLRNAIRGEGHGIRAVGWRHFGLKCGARWW